MVNRQEIRIPALGTDNTRAIQNAIDQAQNGPVSVIFEPGGHIAAGLRLRSNVTLDLQEGAELRFIPEYCAYAATEVAVEAEQSNRAMITAQGAERIAIIGAGRIICEGAARFSLGDDPVVGTRIPAVLRPRVLVLDGCRDVTLQGITVLDSPMWTLHFIGCSDLSIDGVRVDNDRRMPNTDGIVIDGCQKVSITHCEIRTADDGVVLKTSARVGGGIAGECRDIRVADCVVESRSCALKVGTESFALFRDLVFEDCRIEASNRGLGIFSRDGGAVENVRFSRITVDCHETPDGFWGSGEALTISVLDRRPHLAPAGVVRGVVVEDVSGTMQGAINLCAEHAGGISQVSIDRVGLQQVAGPLGTAQAYDTRPTPMDLEPSPDSEGRVNAWRKDAKGRIVGLIDYPGGMPALFARNVDGLKLSHFEVSQPSPLPEGWNLSPIDLGP
jgi:polygalacturonase